MSNIHTLSSLEEKSDEETNLLTTNHYGVDTEYRERQPKALRYLELVFPACTWKSSIFAISVIQLIVYIATLIVGSDYFLTPSSATLELFGANKPSLIAAGQVHRLLCPIFLHSSIFHILLNLFFQLRMGFLIEKTYGVYSFLILYFVSGIGGGLLSAAALFCNVLKVGASTSGFGLIGCEIAEFVLAWNSLHLKERVFLDMGIYMLISGVLIFSVNGQRLDHFGHFGGLLCGFCLTIIYNSKMEDKPSWYQAIRYGSMIVLGSIFVVCLPILFAIDRHCSEVA
ncbi:rhomboid protease ROM2 [Cardiosporidium cionae]|uniref:Rhomboid-like protease n=1 Tax=Cardiosporidium cionae TaxID=476202 RepID=A0ABQ7JCX0_9APIC|nr:rhomboid protease ROM2 [Cardiosporidium cionae]|eukprot:KAF8821848.1 rhomboid protease ROM2 [Cardiosporidium cionae]